MGAPGPAEGSQVAFRMILGCLRESLLVPFGVHVRYFFGVVFCIAPGVAPGPPFHDFRLNFGANFGTICGAFWRPVDLVIFVTPLVRKLYFGGSGDSLFGTFSACFLESVSRRSL